MEIFIPEVESFYKREKYLQTFWNIAVLCTLLAPAGK